MRLSVLKTSRCTWSQNFVKSKIKSSHIAKLQDWAFKLSKQEIATLSKKLGYGASEAPNAKMRSSHDILVIKHQSGLRCKRSNWDVTAQVATVPLYWMPPLSHIKVTNRKVFFCCCSYIIFGFNAGTACKTLALFLKLFLDENALIDCTVYLYLSWYSGAVHPTGHIDRVPPDVILGSPCPDYSRNNWTHVNTCANTRNMS